MQAGVKAFIILHFFWLFDVDAPHRWGELYPLRPVKLPSEADTLERMNSGGEARLLRLSIMVR